MCKTDPNQTASTITADGWINDGHGGASFGDGLRIALDPSDPTRWVIERSGTTDGCGGHVLDDYNDGHRRDFSLIERLASDGLPTDGLEGWAAWAEGEAARARTEQMREALQTAEARVADMREAVDEAEEKTPRGTFTDRVLDRRVDLVGLMEEDPQPPPPIPGSGEVLLQGVAHLWPMERKAGKSLAMLITAVGIVGAGGRVAVIDRENGATRYALRLKDIATARGLSAGERENLRANLRYFAYPLIRPGDEEEMAAAFAEMDLVIFDSSRTLMSSQDLKEDSSDDYARFMRTTVEPLTERGVATLILDNSGWSESGRPRGTSSKEDLNEQLFVGEKREDFDRATTGLILIEVKDSRDGVTGCWQMRVGGNRYDGWERAPEGVKVGKKGKGEGEQEKEKAARVAEYRDLLAAEPDISNADAATRLGVKPQTIGRYRKEIDREFAAGALGEDGSDRK
jgi:hypothetical protein